MASSSRNVRYSLNGANQNDDDKDNETEIKLTYGEFSQRELDKILNQLIRTKPGLSFLKSSKLPKRVIEAFRANDKSVPIFDNDSTDMKLHQWIYGTETRLEETAKEAANRSRIEDMNEIVPTEPDDVNVMSADTSGSSGHVGTTMEAKRVYARRITREAEDKLETVLKAITTEWYATHPANEDPDAEVDEELVKLTNRAKEDSDDNCNDDIELYCRRYDEWADAISENAKIKRKNQYNWMTEYIENSGYAFAMLEAYCTKDLRDRLNANTDYIIAIDRNCIITGIGVLVGFLKASENDIAEKRNKLTVKLAKFKALNANESAASYKISFMNLIRDWNICTQL